MSDFAPPSPDQERTALQAQADWLKRQLDAIVQRLGALEKS